MLAWLVAVGPAGAVELWGSGPIGDSSVQVTEDAEIRYHQIPVSDELEGFEDRNVQDYIEQVNRLNLLLSKEGLSIGAQIDEVALFSNRYILDDELMHSHQLYDNTITSPFPDAYVKLEKLYLVRSGRWGEVGFGDVYASFGRGIALNIVKNTDIDVDTSIRGAKGILRRGPVDVTLVSGLTNKQQIAQDVPNVENLISEDTKHMVTGARVEHYALGPAAVGAHGVLYTFGRGGFDDLNNASRYVDPVDVMVGGATLGLPGLGGIDWYLEGDLIDLRSDALRGEADEALGYAAYGSASAYPGRTVLTFEGKRTENTERLQAFTTADQYEVSNVPTLEYERVITEDSSAAVNSNDLTGAKLRVDYAARPGELTGYVSFAGFRDLDTDTLHFNQTPENIGHAMAGLEWYGDHRVVQLNVGARADVRDAAREGADRLVHIDGEIQLPVGNDGIEIAFAARQFQWGTNAQQQNDFLAMENALGYHRGEKWMFLLYQDFTNNPLVTSTGNLSMIDDSLYAAGEIVYKASGSTTWRAFYGAYKAGIRCSGGQCRQLPGFEGARLSMNTRF